MFFFMCGQLIVLERSISPRDTSKIKRSGCLYGPQPVASDKCGKERDRRHHANVMNAGFRALEKWMEAGR